MTNSIKLDVNAISSNFYTLLCVWNQSLLWVESDHSMVPSQRTVDRNYLEENKVRAIQNTTITHYRTHCVFTTICVIQFNMSLIFQGSFALRFVMHVLIALVFGYLYRNVGESSSTLMANYIFVYGSNLFLHYTGQMAVSLACECDYYMQFRINWWPKISNSQESEGHLCCLDQEELSRKWSS